MEGKKSRPSPLEVRQIRSVTGSTWASWLSTYQALFGSVMRSCMTFPAGLAG